MKTHLMKILKFIPILSFVLFSCNAPDKKVLSEEEMLVLKKQENDSLMIVFDSLMQIKVDMPLLIDSSFISVECLESFNRLARETKGEIKVLTNSKFVTKTLIEIIKNYSSDNSDLMIIIDKTSSMEDDLDNIKKGLDQILSTLSRYKNIRFSVATYGDKNIDGNLWYDFKNFENDFKETSKFINNIKMTHGGDFPESVYDGIYEAFQENFWKSDSKRMVILIGDAPSLDSTLTTHRIEDVLAIAKRDKINMNFYPIVLSPYAGEELIGSETRMGRINLINNIYPNPSSGLISVDMNNYKGLTIEIIDQKGIISKTLTANNSTERIDLYDLPNGLYMIRVYDKFKNFDERKIVLSK